MLLVYQWLTDVLMRTIQVDTYHQTATPHILYLVTLDLLQLLYQVAAYLACVFHEMFLFENVEYGQRSSTGQVVAAKCSTQLSVYRLEFRRNQYGTHRESVGNTFRYRDDVWLDVQPLMGKELTATAVSALYLVANQRNAKALAGICQILGKLRSCHLDAADALDALQDDGTDTTA